MFGGINLGKGMKNRVCGGVRKEGRDVDGREKGRAAAGINSPRSEREGWVAGDTASSRCILWNYWGM